MGPLVTNGRFINKLLILIPLLIFGYFVVHFAIIGITTKPSEGDSLSFHIPIAKEVLVGHIFHPNTTPGNFMMYPATGETLLVLFMKLRIPLNLFNVVAWLLLFFSLLYVGKVFQFEKWYNVVFGVSFCVLYGVLRWIPTQKIDLWLLSFYLFAFAFLNKTKDSALHYALLGFFTGMVLGSKYSAPGMLLVLFIFYYKNFFKYLNLKRSILFLTLVIFFGGFWYIRNFFITGDPLFPQPFLFFRGDGNGYLQLQIWKSILQIPVTFVDMVVSEYMIWSATFIFLPAFLIFTIIKKNFKKYSAVNTIILLGLVNLLLYLFFPGGENLTNIIHGFRYIFPTAVFFMLSVFLLGKMLKREKVVGVIAIANIAFVLLPIPYHPKLLFVFVPATTLSLYLLIYFSSKLHPVR